MSMVLAQIIVTVIMMEMGFPKMLLLMGILLYATFMIIEYSSSSSMNLGNAPDFNVSDSRDFVCLISNDNKSVTINSSELFKMDELETGMILKYSMNDDNSTLKHCGKCGSCSNHNDISIYHSTNHSLTKTSFYCALLSIFFGRHSSNYCLSFINFTPNCQQCWLENILCDRKYCLTTCIMYKVFGRGEKRNGLDPCLYCDESKCGPAFMTCAGANRRRCGIITDIGRSDQEMCKLA